MVTKREPEAFEFQVTKVRELSAMGGFTISQETAEQAVTRALARPVPDLDSIKKKIEVRLANGPRHHLSR
ncbi:MAG: hypothetical protein LV479_04975 [Methylacidiphilales bacterium]|nr:hypothetical protein [Candidatus Methylacidiphilales bacterium]